MPLRSVKVPPIVLVLRGGLTADWVEVAIALVKKHSIIKSATIASFDPACDTQGKFLEAGLRCARKLVEIAPD